MQDNVREQIEEHAGLKKRYSKFAKRLRLLFQCLKAAISYSYNVCNSEFKMMVYVHNIDIFD